MTDLSELAGQVLAGDVRIEDALKIAAPGLERITKWQPAFDKRDPNPSKDYGIHGVEVTWILKGPKGGVIWSIFTNWQLPHVTKEAHARTQRGDVEDVALKVRYQPTGAQVESHGLRPLYDGQAETREGCLLVPGGVCYSDAEFLAGDTLLKRLIEEGGDAVWAELQARYDALPEPEGETS